MKTLSTLALSALLLTACAQNTATPGTDRDDTPYNVTSELPASTFGTSGSGAYGGTLFVRGYADVTTVNEPFCTENCQTFDYAFFTIQDTSSDTLRDFLPENEGNAYVGPSALGLGCVTAENLITYSNHSDRFQMKEFTLSPRVSNAILTSSNGEPIILKLTKEALSGGSEAPACYSHFTDIDLITRESIEP